MTHLSTTLFIPAFQLGHTNQFPSFETRRLNFQSPLQEFDSKFEIGLGNECVRFICKAEMEVMSKMGFAETTIFPTSARYPPIRLGTSAAKRTMLQSWILLPLMSTFSALFSIVTLLLYDSVDFLLFSKVVVNSKIFTMCKCSGTKIPRGKISTLRR